MKILIASVFLLLMPMAALAATPAGCPTTCTGGLRLYVDIACQQKRIEKGPDVASCCVYYCAAAPDPDRSKPNPTSGIVIDSFKPTVDIKTAAGVATLIATGFQMFLGLVAIYAVLIAVRSAIAMSNPSGDAMAEAQKSMTAAIIGVVICGVALGVLQLIINFFGLGSINDVFNSIGPILGG